MKFLSWQTAALAGAIAIPLLLLLYFLKLRRIERTISSTLLWKKAIQDLQVNSPFQRLRKNLLLFLQLLVLGAVLFALASPVANFDRVIGRNIVMLIDHSGSMNAIEADAKPRLDHAKRAAVEFVRDMPKDARAMVISFSDRANVVCSFTDDTRRLRELINAIPPTDGVSRIGEALQLAAAQGAGTEARRHEDEGDQGGSTNEASAGIPSADAAAIDIELFSDGRIVVEGTEASRHEDEGDQGGSTNKGDNAPSPPSYVPQSLRASVPSSQVRYYRVGETADNVGIVGLDVRRDFEKPGFLSIFVQVENFGSSPVTSDVTLSLDGKLLAGGGAVQEVALGAGENVETSKNRKVETGGRPRPAPSTKGEGGAAASLQNVLFELEHNEGGVVTVRWEWPDALEMDNSVSAPIEPPKPMRVLIVTDRPLVEFFIHRPMADFGVQQAEAVSTKIYESMADAKLSAEGRCAYDVVFIDNHDTDRLPPGNYVFLGGLPKIEGVSRGEEIVGKPLVYGREGHPLLRAVSYESLFVGKWRRLKLPAYAMPLIEGEDSAVVAMLSDPGHRYVLLSFDLLESDFPYRPSFPMFLQNVIGYLAGGGVAEAGRMALPGDTVKLTVPSGAEKVTVKRPDGGEEVVELGDRASSGSMAYSLTRDVGIYQATFDDAKKSTQSFAVNSLSAAESRIAPNKELALGSQRVESMEAAKKVNESLWPYAAAGALVLVLLEWWVYNRRVMI